MSVPVAIGSEILYNNRKVRVTDRREQEFTLWDEQFQVAEKLSLPHLQQLWIQGRIRFPIGPEISKKIPELTDPEMMSSRQLNEWNRAQKRLYCIEPLLDTDGLHQAIRERSAQLKNQGIKASVSSLYEWRRAYLQANKDVRALTTNWHRCGGVGNSRLPQAVQNVVTEKVKQYQLTKVPLPGTRIQELVEYELQKQGLDRVPSISTVARAIRKLGKYQRAKHQYGNLYVQSRYGFSSYVKPPNKPLEIVQCDSTNLDVILVDDVTRKPLGKRATLTLMIDVYSRYVIGVNITFDGLGYYATMLTLLNALTPKDVSQYLTTPREWIVPGLPEKIIMDRGKEHDNSHMRAACDALGIETFYCVPQKAWARGVIERFMRTRSTQLDHLLAGTTFSNPVEKKRRDYNSQKRASIGYKEFLALFYDWLLNYYHVKFHEGIEDVPQRRWEEASVLTPYMPDGSYENLRVKLLPFENRTIQKDGIHWEGLTYQSHELWKYGIQLPDGKSVSFKYDPGDIGKIHVYNASSDSYMIVPCTQSDQVDGRSLYVHRVIRGELAKIRMKADRQSMIKVTANTVEKIKTEEAKKDKVSRRTVKIRGIGNNQSDNQIELLEKSIAPVSVKSNRKRLDDDKVNTWGTKIDDTI